MKRFILTLLCAMIALGSIAQNAKNVLEIDQSSFRPVQTDVLKGVTIDAIKVDHSKRPCARIKMHVNRMTREEIDQIAVKTVGGMVELTKRITATEGNGIIFELTAKPETRFYIHHDKYGDSNEVMVNLEGNKEYRIDAQLNMLLSITVASNTNDAEVYIDEVFKGRTANGSVLTVEDVTPGSHTLKLKYGSSVKEQRINVNSSNIFFRQEVDIEGMRPQYVVFNLEPKYATVFIDGKPIITGSTGVAQTVLQNGTYSWRVMATGYHEQSGQVTVFGEKIVKNISLAVDAAMVTISAGEGAEIWVNNELKGVSPWRGQLFSGTYIFEARKAGHRTTTLAQTITSSQPEQSYTLNPPQPIRGTLNISSEPAMADVYVDGKAVGQTPLFMEAMVGEHTVELLLKGYAAKQQTIVVEEGKTATVEIALSSKLKVGDYYDDGINEGVVFWVDKTGERGKIVSLQEEVYQWASDKYEQMRLIGADDRHDGAKNMRAVQWISNWRAKYHAFRWCADLGEGWYLPAIEELKLFTLDKSVHEAVNQTLAIKGEKLEWTESRYAYLSSTESRKMLFNVYTMCYVDLRHRFDSEGQKYRYDRVRAVANVPFAQSKPKAATTIASTNTKSYKVGDYYNENGKEGVVFWVDETGQHGKIVSLTKSDSQLKWAPNTKEQKRLIGTYNRSDGAKNMAIVKQIRGWESKYPAFKWCADLGEGWYLPAIEELKLFMRNKAVRSAVNETLAIKGTELANAGQYDRYWSSTEEDEQYDKLFCAWRVNMPNGYTSTYYKYDFNYVRAVAAF